MFTPNNMLKDIIKQKPKIPKSTLNEIKNIVVDLSKPDHRFYRIPEWDKSSPAFHSEAVIVESQDIDFMLMFRMKLRKYLYIKTTVCKNWSSFAGKKQYIFLNPKGVKVALSREDINKIINN